MYIYISTAGVLMGNRELIALLQSRYPGLRVTALACSFPNQFRKASPWSHIAPRLSGADHRAPVTRRDPRPRDLYPQPKYPRTAHSRVRVNPG